MHGPQLQLSAMLWGPTGGEIYEDRVLRTCCRDRLDTWRTRPAASARPLGVEDPHPTRPPVQGRSPARLLPLTSNQRGLPIVFLAKRRCRGGTGNREAHRPAA